MFLCVLAFAACNREESNGPGGAESPAPAATTSPTDARAAEVLAAWHRYWDVYVSVGSDLNLPDPRLTEVSTGEALRALNSGFIALKAGGEVVKGTVELAPRIVMVDEASATLTDCYTNRLFRFRADSGEPSGTTDPTTRLVNVGMVLERGSWKVKTISHESDGCVPVSH